VNAVGVTVSPSGFKADLNKPSCRPTNAGPWVRFGKKPSRIV